MNTVIWLTGLRSGSNDLGGFLEACGGHVRRHAPLAPSEWNREWVEDGFLLHQLAALGAEEDFLIPRQARPETLDAEWLWTVEGYYRSALREAAGRPLVVKSSGLPFLSPELTDLLPDVRHVLVTTARSRADRVDSLMRLFEHFRPRRTAAQAAELFDRHDAAVEALVPAFGRRGWPVVRADLDAEKRTAVEWERVGRAVGLDPTVRIVRGFLPADECQALTDWALGRVGTAQFVDGLADRGGTRTPLRRTTRMAAAIDYPPLAYAVRDRIADRLRLAGRPPIRGHGKDGIVCVVHFDGADTYPHRDPAAGDGLDALRCNVVTQTPDAGGTLHVAGEARELAAGDLHAYRVNVHEHRVEACRGRPRVAWLFGWCVPGGGA
jgi:hypothetical protein